jgi:hypothetical protein
MDDRSNGNGSGSGKQGESQDEYLYLWRVLLDELRFLRPAGHGLHDAVFKDPQALDSKCLAPLFARVHAWSAPVGAVDVAPAPPGTPEEHAAEKPAAETPPLTALCFSGGGIRSATFNLGVIQGLAKVGLLGRFDYLSSVSGGGYIASWLGRWLEVEGGGLKGLGAVKQALAAEPPLDVEAPEARQVSYLRAFSNYLTPRLGLLSADTWTLVAIGVRNILLNWLVLVPLITAPLVIPLLAVARWPAFSEDAWQWLLLAAFLLEGVGLFFVSLFSDTGDDMRAAAARRTGLPGGEPRRSDHATPERAHAAAPASERLRSAGAGEAEPEPPRPDAAAPKGHPFLLLGLLPRLLALPGILVGFFLCFFAPSSSPRPAPTWSGLIVPCLVWSIGLPLLALWASGPLFGRRRVGLLDNSICLLLAGAAEASILAAVFAGWAPGLIGSSYPLYPILGPGLVLGPVLLGRTLYVALSSVAEHMRPPDFDDAEREWWARWSAWALICSVVWIAASALVLFAPTLLASTRAQVAALISAGGLGGLIAGLGTSGRTPPTEDKAANPDQGGGWIQSLLMALAAPLFVVAVVLCLSTGAQHLLAIVQGDPWPPAADTSTPAVQAAGNLHVEIAGAAAATGAPPAPLRADFQVKGGTAKTSAWTYVAPYGGCGATELAVIAALVLFGALAGYPVNINRFSMQAGYRNRLIRAYLGASNARRRPNAFTGFDRRDNVPLSDLQRNRPFPVVNIALNLVRGQNLAWQERKAESFTATPFHCGSYQLGYRRTADYGGQGGLSLGSAVATSGAAANPNMGFNSSPAITFIMTLFSVRLGAWLGNPRSTGRFAAYKRNGPRFSARVLLAEAFGWTDDTHPYISLSDGGHFEDLGVYEMVRRRCRVILACDAGADPGYGFKDLGNAIRKIRIDFGIPIVFTDRVYILPKSDASEDARYCAVAEIQYDKVDAGASNGTLIYIKPSICRQPSPTPFDVANYARFSRDFPHETTADQWFTETQFESYRALGEDAIRAMAFLKAGPCTSLDELVQRVTRDYLPQTKAQGKALDVAENGGPQPGAA